MKKGHALHGLSNFLFRGSEAAFLGFAGLAVIPLDDAQRQQTGADGKPIEILDVGCGAGFFELLLQPLGYEMTGIDLTPDMISRAKELSRQRS